MARNCAASEAALDDPMAYLYIQLHGGGSRLLARREGC